MSKWKIVALAEVAEIERNSVQASAIRDGTLYVGLENIQSGGDFLNVREVDEGELASSKFAFSEEHLLFGKLRPYLAKIARPTFAGVCSTDILPIKPGSLLDRDYLSHFLRQPDMVDLANSRATGANLPRLSPRVLASFELPLPPLPEQRRIAAILDHAETLRTQRRAALAQLESLTQSIFLDMFGDAEASRWPVATIADIADGQKGAIRTGPFGSQLLHSEFVNEGIAVLGIDNAVSNEFRWGERRFISPEKYRELKRYTVRPGDVLITIMGTCGRCAVVPKDAPIAINTKHLCCITVDSNKCDPLFLHAYFLRHPMARKYLEQTAKGAIMEGLNMGIIKALPIPLPPLPRQQAFATRIQAIEALKAKHRATLAELDALFASLQHRAFNGELNSQALTKSKLRTFAELGQLDASKGLEALVYAARRLPNKGHYWPLKVQYVADRKHLERHGRTLYGETHVAMPYGPVPQAAFNASRALAKGELICEFPMDAVRTALRRDGETLVALRDADPGVLGADERESLDWAIRLLADMSFEELKTQTHDTAWDKTPRNAPMAWQDIIDSLAPAARQRLLEQFQ
ncbi:restriction endonuclease subunit S [Hydrogenophaga sp.]|uniref:restriction endonuclease subunit S n=1 Tax=Hydrogenophaga sp. TaxID=1904254 RepID=UPI002FC7CEAF